ncbi:zinc finger protein 70-like [Topomyia yanbarensis]|uniref:zinc finger protein 70-like n=1 Tax=Topomyia yanbarensis TaxID=2498891 RepID=UPI00273B3856|nr:zinc finger protein 70-like [Topomyia yanbarensis]
MNLVYVLSHSEEHLVLSPVSSIQLKSNLFVLLLSIFTSQHLLGKKVKMSAPVLLSETCRCCLTRGTGMFDVFVALDEFNNKICDLIESCAGVLVRKGDPFSKIICEQCLNELVNAVRFRQRCLNTDLLLKNTRNPLRNIETKSLRSDISRPGTFKEEIDDHTPNSYTSVQSHAPLVPPKTESRVASDEIEQKDSSHQFTCEICCTVFNNKHSLLSHKVVHSSPPVHTTLGVTPRINPMQSAKIKRSYACEICGKNFYKACDVKKHIRIHTGERPHECDECGKSFIESSHLMKHKRGHIGKRNYKCYICDKSFMASNTLAQHMHTHSNDLPHKCEICSRGFYKRSLLVYHIRTHTGERPYQCDICDRKFIRGNLLRQHIRMHTGERTHKCEICGKEFIESCRLLRHMRIHTGDRPHKCSICGKGFIQNCNLTRHMLIHNSSKSQKCDTCDKEFPTKGKLIQHLRSHNNDPLNKCDICERPFFSNGQLMLHRKTHDGKGIGKWDTFTETC